MAAVRVRLVFEYPPPLLPASRMCWLLVQPQHCRVVADLESIIRQRFGFSASSTRLHLFVDSCLLPPNESIHLVRDNDCIRVQQEELITENGFVTSNSPDWLAVKPKKRRRQQSQEIQQTQSESSQRKKKRKEAGLKAEHRHNSAEETELIGNVERAKKRKKVIEDDGQYNIQKKHCKKKKDKFSKDQTRRDDSRKRASSGFLGKALSGPAPPTPHAEQGEGKNVSNDTPPQGKVAVQAVDSEYSSSSISESDHPQPNNTQLAMNGTITKTVGKGISPISTRKQPNSRRGKRPAQTDVTPKVAGVKSDSNCDSLSSDSETPVVKRAFTLNREALPPVDRISGPFENGESSAACSDSRDSESGKTKSGAGAGGAAVPGKTVTEGYQPTAATLLPSLTGNCNFGQGNGRGRGRGFNGFPWRGGRQQRGAFQGRGRGTGSFRHNCENSEEPKPGDSSQMLTNKQPIVKSSSGPPKRDYSKLPLLAAPPQVGERIAFKMLELSENYTPELSDYKEGRIVSYNANTQEVELCVDSISTERSKEPGKFDLIYPTKNGEDMVEYAVTRQPQVTESWSALIEPRLIVSPRAEPVDVEFA
ncbi:coilin isoform X2 [Stegostoma tigrinum]|uniref:coilin isoform X2 n=1 Tax=Stegostoma tigrinum TaxID=3053191 RepID=UPI00286FDC2C|nr:coilin isoform X2 [Stegostoma tigrinum]